MGNPGPCAPARSLQRAAADTGKGHFDNREEVLIRLLFRSISTEERILFLRLGLWRQTAPVLAPNGSRGNLVPRRLVIESVVSEIDIFLPEKIGEKVAKLLPPPLVAVNHSTTASCTQLFLLLGGGREGSDETSFSWSEKVVSEVALLGLSIVFSVVAMTAPTSALTIAPTIISARRPCARTYSPPGNSRVQYVRGVTCYLRLHRRRFQ